ncbi:phosphatase RsbU N-terminal domain-containing protein [Geodermatophilus sp. URMC 61]|uniref:phosphatase RsbU N-terminal domain-containing protein n=1 Tax=Geodermatophilus sp. URMC 61 TaxID=3423411 RepID=UPI00406BFECA
MTARETLLRDYRAAFLRYLSRHEESALDTGYRLGRGALAGGRSLLDVVQVHHEVLTEVLRDSPAEEVPLIARSASDFLLEVLASYDMARRGP